MLRVMVRYTAAVALLAVVFSLWLSGAQASGSPGHLLVDTVLIPDLHQLEVYFAHPVDQGLAQRVSSYNLSTLGTPESVEFSNVEQKALLSYHVNLKSGQAYVLKTPGNEHEFVMRESIQFDSLMQKLKARNSTVQISANARYMLDSTYGMLTEGRDALYSAYLDLSNQISSLPDLVPPPLVGSPVESVYDAMMQMLRETLESNRQNLMTQLINLENQRTDLVSNMERLRQQSELVAKQFTWAAENMLLGHATLQSQLSSLLDNKLLLEKQLSIARLQEQLAMITPADVQAIELALGDLESGLKVLPQQLENIRRELNLLLGQPYDTDTAIGAITLDILDIVELEWDKDRQKAINNNTTLNLLSLEAQNKYNTISRHAPDSHQRRLAELEWENALLQLSEERRRLSMMLARQQEDIENKHDTWERELTRLSLEEDKYRHTTLRHQLGLLSEVQFQTESLALKSRQRAVDDAKREVFTALRKYHWMVEGLTL